MSFLPGAPSITTSVEGLAKVVYHNKLGTQGERIERVRKLARAIGAEWEGDLLARKAWRGTERIDLSAKEFALLATLARRQGEILSKTAIAELVWDMNFDSNTNVVEVATNEVLELLVGDQLLSDGENLFGEIR